MMEIDISIFIVLNYLAVLLCLQKKVDFIISFIILVESVINKNENHRYYKIFLENCSL